MIDCSASLFVELQPNLEFRYTDFTDSFKVVPTHYWKVGDLTAKGGRQRKTSAWEYVSPLANTEEPLAHVERIISDLSIDIARLKLLRKKAIISFWVTVRIYEGLDRPTCVFPREVLLAISDIGASLDIDIY